MRQRHTPRPRAWREPGAWALLLMMQPARTAFLVGLAAALGLAAAQRTGRPLPAAALAVVVAALLLYGDVQRRLLMVERVQLDKVLRDAWGALEAAAVQLRREGSAAAIGTAVRAERVATDCVAPWIPPPPSTPS